MKRVISPVFQKATAFSTMKDWSDGEVTLEDVAALAKVSDIPKLMRLFREIVSHVDYDHVSVRGTLYRTGFSRFA